MCIRDRSFDFVGRGAATECADFGRLRTKEQNAVCGDETRSAEGRAVSYTHLDVYKRQELYCTGSLNLFNHPTNVNLNSRVVCFVLKGMGENLRKIATVSYTHLDVYKRQDLPHVGELLKTSYFFDTPPPAIEQSFTPNWG